VVRERKGKRTVDVKKKTEGRRSRHLQGGLDQIDLRAKQVKEGRACESWSAIWGRKRGKVQGVGGGGGGGGGGSNVG